MAHLMSTERSSAVVCYLFNLCLTFCFVKLVYWMHIFLLVQNICRLMLHFQWTTIILQQIFYPILLVVVCRVQSVCVCWLVPCSSSERVGWCLTAFYLNCHCGEIEWLECSTSLNTFFFCDLEWISNHPRHTLVVSSHETQHLLIKVDCIVSSIVTSRTERIIIIFWWMPRILCVSVFSRFYIRSFTFEQSNR